MINVASKSKAGTTQGTPAYQLLVELDWVQPKVWRRLLVPVTIELPLLHVVLLWSMGWDGGHLHEFVFGQDHYGPSEDGLDVPDEVNDEDAVTLRDALGYAQDLPLRLRLWRQLAPQSERSRRS